jgi:hypothetical protein
MVECLKIGRESDFMKFHLPPTQGVTGAFSLPMARDGTGIALAEGKLIATQWAIFGLE